MAFAAAQTAELADSPVQTAGWVTECGWVGVRPGLLLLGLSLLQQGPNCAGNLLHLDRAVRCKGIIRRYQTGANAD